LRGTRRERVRLRLAVAAWSGQDGEVSAHTLVVLRHAKAEPYAATDRDRALSDRGRADATAAGHHLAEVGITPDYALVSSSRRTVQTWEQVRAVTGPADVELVTDAVYSASPGEVIEALRQVPEESSVALYVGHNPSAEVLVHLLDDGDGDPEVRAAADAGLKPAGLAVFSLPGRWADLGEGSARLVDLHLASD
jgi:phosphohistidine phosphatase